MISRSRLRRRRPGGDGNGNGEGVSGSGSDGESLANVLRHAVRATGRTTFRVALTPDPPLRTSSRFARVASTALAVLAPFGVLLGLIVVANLSTHAGTLGRSTASAGADRPANWLFLTAVVPLLLLWRFPFTAWRICWLVAVLLPLLPGQGHGSAFELFGFGVAFCAAAPRRPRDELWCMAALMLVPIWLWVGPQLHKPVALTIALGIVTAALDMISAGRRARTALAAQTERAEQEQARRAVLEERARIARELHDVVAHHTSLIAVRAETAPYRLGTLPDHIAEEFAALSSAAREALAEMRSLLGVLRDDEPADKTPQPQLADVPGLVAAARSAGARVDLSIFTANSAHTQTATNTCIDPGTPSGANSTAVPAGVGLCAFRIVQEALSNAARHAAGAPVQVTVDQRREELRLEVVNGRAAGPTDVQQQKPELLRNGTGGGGRGLAGMRERVAMLGGQINVGPIPGGGFSVTAVLPLGSAR
jgi:signal transduction histidine kinase